MKNCITIPSVLQSILSAEEVKSIVQTIGYEDKARYNIGARLLIYNGMVTFLRLNSGSLF
ncbi:hypothetical protein SAMN04487970_104325 [Paenibacillus tianmuensis]|uniref:Uncharacterized protein n=1 Tax=Paenibacillus tianmuensis TaxID=624147 RepID=A0A1G4T6B8_9BACL|nr:hypothetical protein SAMN04487970_104325 [Paenibacillus tianmuensis]